MTMTLIETKTLLSAAASIEFTAIPQDFTDLVLQISTRTVSSGSLLYVAFNGDTTNGNYTNRYLQGNGSSAASASDQPRGIGLNTTANDYTANTFSSCFAYISNYSGSTHKSYSSDSVQENNATFSVQWLFAGIWNNTSAITSILLAPPGINFATGSTISLYGITKGSDGIVTTS